MIRNDKAVSNVLGYMLILGIVMVVLSFVFVHTYYMVNQSKDKVKYLSMAQAFEKIQNMINYVAYSETPQRYLRVLLNEGNMGVSKGCYINLSVYPGNGKNCSFSCYSGSIVYNYKNYRVAFENGGVWLKFNGASAIVSSPRIFIYNQSVNKQLVLVMVLTILKGNGSSSGNGFATIYANFNSSNVTVYRSGYLSLAITSSYASAWYNYFEKLKDTNPNVVSSLSMTGDTVRVNMTYGNGILILVRNYLNVSVS